MTAAPYILPVENQVREFDAKLLLACHAANCGHTAYVGYKDAINAHLSAIDSGIYFSKSLTSRAIGTLRVSHRLGHSIVAWDEEAVVHYPPEVYYSRRMNAEAISFIDLLLTWGEDNKLLFEGFPGLPDRPIHIVGNPRADLLRPEFEGFFEDHVREIKNRFGDFILINTNFGTINGFYPGMNVCYPDANAADGLALGRGAIGFERDFAVRLYSYRMQVLDKMTAMVPAIAKAFPDVNIILRPHPAENRAYWREHLAGLTNVHVEANGNVVPWLQACSVLIHNGCTTAIEGYILKRPVIAYVPVPSGEEFATNPPNSVSDAVSTVDGVIEKVSAVLAGNGPAVNDEQRSTLLSRFIASLDGELAAQRIVNQVRDQIQVKRLSPHQRLAGSVAARAKQLSTVVKSIRGKDRYGTDFKRQRFPEITVEKVGADVAKLSAISGLEATPNAELVAPDLFRISL